MTSTEIVGTLEKIVDTPVEHDSIEHDYERILGKIKPSSTLLIRTSEGNYSVFFPLRLSHSKVSKCIKKRIKYTHKLGDLVGDDYEIEIMEGPEKGLTYSGRLVN